MKLKVQIKLVILTRELPEKPVNEEVKALIRICERWFKLEYISRRNCWQELSTGTSKIANKLLHYKSTKKIKSCKIKHTVSPTHDDWWPLYALTWHSHKFLTTYTRMPVCVILIRTCLVLPLTCQHSPYSLSNIVSKKKMQYLWAELSTNEKISTVQSLVNLPHKASHLLRTPSGFLFLIIIDIDHK